ncbi:MAG: hypothetical protein JST22_18815 [Bacteroidetes bacterium]|nr:hypothetical protein [Bacteroidota bacterium]
MSQQQIALCTLTGITYLGADLGNQFTITIQANGEQNPFQVQIPVGANQPFNDHLTGVQQQEVPVALNIPVSITVSGIHAGHPVNGNASMTFTVATDPPEQQFSLPVNMFEPESGSATLMFTFSVIYRDPPVCYDPEWLCRNRFNWAVWQRWLCLGWDNLVDFYTLSPIVSLDQAFTDNAPHLQRLNSELGLGYTQPPVGASFADRQDFTFDTTMAAATSVSTLTWARRYIIDDFAEQVDDLMFDYVVLVYDRLPFFEFDLCRRWRQLLDCYCRFCRHRLELSPEAVAMYDSQAAPQIDGLYTQVANIVQTEAVDYFILPNMGINCDKLFYIVSFWAWWCRRCTIWIGLPVWAPPLDPYYDSLYTIRDSINATLIGQGWNFCNPPENDFCSRWGNVLTCLRHLCDNLALLPQSLIDDIESTFGTLVRSTYQAMGLTGISQTPGIANTCAMLSKIKGVIDFMCPEKAVPGNHARRSSLDDLLVQMEAAQSGFTARHANICDPTVPMTDCGDWQGIISCLSNICNHTIELPADIAATVLSLFGSVIDSIFAIAFPGQGGASASLSQLCTKIAQLATYFAGVCSSGQIDPVKKLALDAYLGALRSANTSLLADYPQICQATVTVPGGWCDEWYDKLNCLKRICRKSGQLDSSVITDFVSTFGSVIDRLDWLSDGPVGSYQARTMTLTRICEALDRILKYLQEICGNGTLDTIRKLRLDEELAQLRTLYDAFLAEYPDICIEADTFCDTWMTMLDCLARTFDRWYERQDDQNMIDLANAVLTSIGGTVDSAYVIVFGGGPQGYFPTDLDQLRYELLGLLEWFADRCACCGGTVTTQQRAQLQASLIAMQSHYDQLAECDAGCTVSQLTLTTGHSAWMITKADDAVLDAPRAPHVVTGTSGIGTPVSGAEWISPRESAADPIEGMTFFQRCFCVCTAGTMRIQLTYLADDYATIYVDDTELDHPTESSMHSSRSLDLTVTLSAGRHCIRAEVRNSPAYNMAYCCAGTITAVSATLTSDTCCAGEGAPIPLCDTVPLSCEELVTLPRLYQFLYCSSRAANDPIYSNAAFTAIANAISCFEGVLPEIIINLGLTPGDVPWLGNGYNNRLQRIIQVMLAAYANFGRLSALLRHRIGCFHMLLRTNVATLALTEVDRPSPCSDSCGTCTQWIDLLSCLCSICTTRADLGAGQSSLAAQIDTLVCTNMSSLYAWATGSGAAGVPLVTVPAPTACCDRLRPIMQVIAHHCLCCTGMDSGIAAQLGAYYTSVKPQVDGVVSVLAGASLLPCENVCMDRRTLLECLVKLCLRRDQLTSSQQSRFDSLFASSSTALYYALFQSMPGSSPLPSDVFGTTCWTLLTIARQFGWICSPYYVWSPDQRADVDDVFATLSANYATYLGELATAGVHFCSDSLDLCGRQAGIPDLYRTLCEVAPNTALAPIAAINAMLGCFKDDIPALQKRLGLAMTSYPTGGSFSDRLEMAAQVAAIAYSRYAELAPVHCLAVDFFYGILSSQTSRYAGLIAGDLPRAATTMSSYRAQWIEFLTCACRACDFVAGLSSADRVAFATIVTLVESPGSVLGTAIATLYTTVLSQSSLLGLPIVNDACATDTCRKLRIVTSFFDIYGLRLSDPAPSVVTAFAASFESVRDAVVTLRGALLTAGHNVCGDENTDSTIVQSGSLYIQAAGSSSADGSVRGVHLRWTLTGDLVHHLPKSNLAKPGTAYHGTNGFNKTNDFVTIYRAPYNPSDRFVAEIDFAAMVPQITGSIGGGVTWTFSNVRVDSRFPDAVTTVTIDFESGLYPVAIPGTPNTAHVQAVLAAYTGVYSAAAIPKTMFAFEVVPQSTGGTPQTQFEAISRNDDPEATEPEFLSCRETYIGLASPHRITSEAIDSVDFKCTNAKPSRIRLETFEDFYIGTKRRYLWKRIGDFGLSTDSTEVYNRLEDTSRYTVDGQWPRFDSSPATLAAGVMRMNVANYQDRWEPGAAHNRHPEQSLRSAVVQYLDFSKDPANIDAWVDKPSVMPTDNTSMKISLLQMLLLAGQDYHIARMLGLGYIDTPLSPTNQSDPQQFVYFAEYSAVADPTSDTTVVVHRYLTLPTGQYDDRLPVAPEVDALDYHFGEPFTDSDGYTRFGDVRYVRVYRKPLEFDLPVDGFYQTSSLYSRGKRSRPIQFGVKYGEMQGPNPNDPVVWAVPDPSNDAPEYAADDYVPYRDHALYPEVVPIPDSGPDETGRLLVYTHRIEKAGNVGPHKYGLYGINWFSRVSPELNLSDVSDNQFPVRNLLMPPLNLAAQFIQPEDPPVFTTVNEQTASLFGKTRVTFNWNHNHNIAYQRADAVDLYFRSEPSMNIKGQVLTSKVSGGFATVTTTSYVDISALVPGGETVAPTIQPSDTDRFKGSMLVTPSEKFPISAVTRDAGTGFPVFVVEVITLAGSDGTPGTGPVVAPIAGELFLVVENLNRVIDEQGIFSGWTRLDNNRIPLLQFNEWPFPVGPVYTEPVTVNQRTENVPMGGLTDMSASVTRYSGSGFDGVYKVIMPSTTLFPYTTKYPGALVDFYRGTARVQLYTSLGEVKVVDVLKIDSNSPLTIYVYDADTTPGKELAPAVGSATVRVNFHPGYRAYIDLHLDGVTDANILPVAPEASRITYMAAKSVDTLHQVGMEPYRSVLSTPVIHLSRLQIAAEQPQALYGPMFATRPDVYGKATYMFDTPLRSGRTTPPYGLLFCRADEMAILSILYTQATIRDQILPNLPPSGDDAILDQRWTDLIQVNTDGSGLFPTYPGETFHFPKPDRATEANYIGHYSVFDGAHTPSSIKPDILNAIAEAFLPLTESYVVYDQISSASLQTSSSRPVIRGADGGLLKQGDAGYDPYPMIRRGTAGGATVVRFADYTLDGASHNIYFYYVRELNNELKSPEKPSPIIGPVRLVNTMPPVAPNILSVRAQSNDSILGLAPAVIFTFNRYPDVERITHVRIYRTSSEAASTVIRSMKLVAEVELPTTGTDPYSVADTFSDLASGEAIPFSQPLFYRLVAMRTITNENNAAELVPSIPSETVLASVMDTASPSAPIITPGFTPMPNAVTPDRLTSVTLTWPNATSGGTYTLFKMTAQGQWQKVTDFLPSNASQISYDWSADHAGDPDLPKIDADGNPVYHRFKVTVLNSSGLGSLNEEMLVL